MQTLGQKIKAIRLGRGLTTGQFADKIGTSCSKGTVSKWENGIYTPSPERLKRIAELGNITVEDLLEEKRYMENITTAKEAVGFVHIKLLDSMNEIEFTGLSYEYNPKTGERRIVIDYKDKMREEEQ